MPYIGRRRHVVRAPVVNTLAVVPYAHTWTSSWSSSWSSCNWVDSCSPAVSYSRVTSVVPVASSWWWSSCSPTYWW